LDARRTPLNATWILFAAAFLLSLGLTPLFRKIALRTQFLDNPAGQLKKHTAPVPYLGGLAVCFAFALSTLGAVILVAPADLNTLLALLAGGGVVALLGLWDDLFGLGPGFKFLVQVLAALLLVGFGVKMEFLPSQPVLGIVLTVLWIVAVTNAVNLVDIMDGLAGSVALVACVGFILVPLPGEQTYVNLAAAALGGSLLGFLPFNWRPARIYLGDTGALFTGYILAGVALGERYTQLNTVGLFAPLLILGVPLYDTSLVTALRLMKGRSPFKGSNDHLALRLRALGLSVPQVAALLAGTGVVLAFSSYLLIRLSEKRALFLMFLLGSMAMVLSFLVSQITMETPTTGHGTPRRLFPDKAPRPPKTKRRPKGR